jgi:uncharacterized protein YozE (UPF0346 family)
MTELTVLMGAEGASSSAEIFKKKYGISQYPTEIKHPMDSRLAIRERNSIGKESLAHSEARLYITEFDSLITPKVLDALKTNLDILDSFDYIKVIDEAKKNNKKIEQLLTDVSMSVLSYDINPALYFAAKKHFIITKVALESINGSPNIAELKKTIAKGLSEKQMVDFKFGIFIGLEQVAVTTAFSPKNRDDFEFISKYTELTDRYAYYISEKLPVEYLKATQLYGTAYSDNTYLKFSKELGEDRNEMLL